MSTFGHKIGIREVLEPTQTCYGWFIVCVYLEAPWTDHRQ